MSLLAVNHHYYRESSPRSGIYPINRAALAAEVGRLRRNHRPVGQHELLECLADPAGGEGDAFLLTFDDGLKEQMSALHDLEALGVPALFFVPTAPLAEGRVLDVHKLHLIRSILDDEALLAELSAYFRRRLSEEEVAGAALQYRYDGPTARHVKYFLNFVLTPTEREEWMARTFSASVGNEADVARALYMDQDDVRVLSAKGMLGTHAHSHLPLARLAPEDMTRDIGASLDVLETISGARVQGISFPYGGPDAISRKVEEVCAGLGLQYGFTMLRGRNDAADLEGRFRLKRIDCNDLAEYT